MRKILKFSIFGFENRVTTDALRHGCGTARLQYGTVAVRHGAVATQHGTIAL